MSKQISIKDSVYSELSKYRNATEMSWSDTVEIMIERSRENVRLKKQIEELNRRLEKNEI